MASTMIDPLLEQIQQALPEFLVNRRWYRSKARNISTARLQDVISANGFLILLAAVEYTDGHHDTYVLATTSSAHEGHFDEVVTTLETEDGAKVTVFSAFSQRAFRDMLFHAMLCGASFPGQYGELRAEPNPDFFLECQQHMDVPDSSLSSVEQSNTSIIYGHKYIVKMFRKLEEGLNPDIEVGRFLTRQKFANTPAVLGALEYRHGSDGKTYAAGILQEFVANQGDAWKYTLDSLSDFFPRALAQPYFLPLSTHNPLDLMTLPVPPEIAALMGPYLTSAELLGQRTAEMHIALASSDDRAFAPEPFTPHDAELLQDQMVAQALSTLTLVREKQASPKLLALEPHILGRFSFLKAEAITASRIRIHGDYHLGQVLYTGSDFMIIDFEGEPARPLMERRGKTLPLKDVAGMARSFHYAAFAALFGLVPGVPTDAESLPKVEAWANVWTGWVTAAFLRSYFNHAQGQAFLPKSEHESRLLLNAFLLQKALYEVEYELNNRPGWLGIPMRGILSLVE